jgi:hypothetical protein
MGVPNGYCLAIDCAFPPGSYGLFADVDVVMGYGGGDTPHVWSISQIEQAVAAGKTFIPIYTVPLDITLGALQSVYDSIVETWNTYVAQTKDNKILNCRNILALDAEASLWDDNMDVVKQLLSLCARSNELPPVILVYGSPTHFVNEPKLWAWHVDWMQYNESGPLNIPSNAGGWYAWQFAGNMSNAAGSYDASLLSIGMLNKAGFVYTKPAVDPAPPPNPVVVGTVGYSYNKVTGEITLRKGPWNG